MPRSGSPSRQQLQQQQHQQQQQQQQQQPRNKLKKPLILLKVQKEDIAGLGCSTAAFRVRYPALLPELKRRLIRSKLVPAVEAVCSTACSAVQLSADEVQLHISRPRFWETEDKHDTFVEVLAYGPVDMASALAGMLTAEGTLPLPAPYSAPGFLGAAMLTVGLETGAKPTLSYRATRVTGVNVSLSNARLRRCLDAAGFRTARCFPVPNDDSTVSMADQRLVVTVLPRSAAGSGLFDLQVVDSSGASPLPRFQHHHASMAVLPQPVSSKPPWLRTEQQQQQGAGADATAEAAAAAAGGGGSRSSSSSNSGGGVLAPAC